MGVPDLKPDLRPDFKPVIRPSPKPTSIDTMVSEPPMPKTTSSPSPPPPTSPPRGLIFVKTYKTASTTVAQILNTVASTLRLTALHPEDRGWFSPGELTRRHQEGQTFDLSYRHVTPVVDYEALQSVVPNSLLTSAFRDPRSKFVSMYNFVKSTSGKYGDPLNLARAVAGGTATREEVNDNCNNNAYVLSGDTAVLGVLSAEDQGGYADRLIGTLDGMGMVPIVAERIPESMVVVCDMMGWPCYDGTVTFRDGKERQQKGGKIDCNDACWEEAKKCNLIDVRLYEHYVRRLDELLESVQDLDSKVAAITEGMTSGKSAQKYPVNCKMNINPAVKDFEELHTCAGRRDKGWKDWWERS